MKKILLLLMLTVTALGCSGDDDNNNGVRNPYTGSVVGTWTTVGLSIDGNLVNLDCDAPAPVEDNYTFVFYEDGFFDIYHNCDPEGVIYASGTYTTTGNVLRINLDGMEGRAHMIDYLDEDQLQFEFSIGSEGLFYGYVFTVQQQF